jgi:Rrf2 family transcriptional regulator, iron-sulfur cluster assembly transcription factor
VYGKSTETAIAAMSRLAEVYDGGQTLLSGADIASSRGLQRPFVAKVLSTLSQAGLISGSRGPGGGFTFARPPKEIRLYDVFVLFERTEDSDACPFGGGICGVGEKCPLHDKLVAVQRATDRMLRDTTFDVFRLAYQKRQRGAAAEPTAAASGRRESFRATAVPR